ncbi:hypothetical protein CBR_g34779 [Chara braunii]|uniref:Uncharacterized protein n=1 Tax=Chara braunii TaxID=69332 RepID=A0A388LJI1_CHABU|nr:hypothetical protein CBR_g34779 [Chara braunii]|eukprot:GBG82403.1 hypothetical protein CBR_g34779 [Chara braunii]
MMMMMASLSSASPSGCHDGRDESPLTSLKRGAHGAEVPQYYSEDDEGAEDTRTNDVQINRSQLVDVLGENKGPRDSIGESFFQGIDCLDSVSPDDSQERMGVHFLGAAVKDGDEVDFTESALQQLGSQRGAQEARQTLFHRYSRVLEDTEDAPRGPTTVEVEGNPFASRPPPVGSDDQQDEAPPGLRKGRDGIETITERSNGMKISDTQLEHVLEEGKDPPESFAEWFFQTLDQRDSLSDDTTQGRRAHSMQTAQQRGPGAVNDVPERKVRHIAPKGGPAEPRLLEPNARLFEDVHDSGLLFPFVDTDVVAFGGDLLSSAGVKTSPGGEVQEVQPSPTDASLFFLLENAVWSLRNASGGVNVSSFAGPFSDTLAFTVVDMERYGMRGKFLLMADSGYSWLRPFRLASYGAPFTLIYLRDHVSTFLILSLAAHPSQPFLYFSTVSSIFKLPLPMNENDVYTVRPVKIGSVQASAPSELVFREVRVSQQAFSADGQLMYVADCLAGAIYRVWSSTGEIERIGGDDSGSSLALLDLECPRGLALTFDGCHLFVTECHIGRIRLISFENSGGPVKSTRILAGKSSSPYAYDPKLKLLFGLAMSADEKYLYVGGQGTAIYQFEINKTALPSCSPTPIPPPPPSSHPTPPSPPNIPSEPSSLSSSGPPPSPIPPPPLAPVTSSSSSPPPYVPPSIPTSSSHAPPPSLPVVTPPVSSSSPPPPSSAAASSSSSSHGPVVPSPSSPPPYVPPSIPTSSPPAPPPPPSLPVITPPLSSSTSAPPSSAAASSSRGAVPGTSSSQSSRSRSRAPSKLADLTPILISLAVIFPLLSAAVALWIAWCCCGLRMPCREDSDRFSSPGPELQVIDIPANSSYGRVIGSRSRQIEPVTSYSPGGENEWRRARRVGSANCSSSESLP